MIFQEEDLLFLMKKPGRPKEINKNFTENLTRIVKEERRINTWELSTHFYQISSQWMRHHYHCSFLNKKESKWRGNFLERPVQRSWSCWHPTENQQCYQYFGTIALFLLTIWIQEPISIVNTTQHLRKQQERNEGRAGFVIFSTWQIMLLSTQVNFPPKLWKCVD